MILNPVELSKIKNDDLIGYLRWIARKENDTDTLIDADMIEHFLEVNVNIIAYTAYLHRLVAGTQMRSGIPIEQFIESNAFYPHNKKTIRRLKLDKLNKLS